MLEKQQKARNGYKAVEIIHFGNSDVGNCEMFMVGIHKGQHVILPHDCSYHILINTLSNPDVVAWGSKSS